ncbi:lipopolysaccharide biosynthesis protein [Stenotrophomonas rhizophila]|uniref:lipopolysaccharide biosynthesis protein n=1 Tax=Stenotrophomonas rhizophila TaxID=216778 RepID=UPI0033934403
MVLSRIRKRLSGLTEGALWQGVLKLLVGTVLARVIGILAMPILARIYSPTDHGVLAVYVSMVTILAPILSLRYALAVPLPRRDGTALNLLVLSFVLKIVTTSALACVLYFAGERLFKWMSMETLTPWWWMIVAGAFAMSAYELLSMWATRRRNYHVIAVTKFTQSLFGELVKIGFGLLGIKPFGLILGHLVSQGAGVGTFVRSFRADFARNARFVRIRTLWWVAKYYAGFPGYRLVSQLLLAFSMQAPLVFMAALYGPNLTGQLGLALMALTLPVSLIGQAVGQAFYGEIARLAPGSGRRIHQLTMSVQKRLFLVGIPFSAVLFFAGEWLFTIAFGPNWAVAGRFAELLAPFVLMQLTSAPLMQVLNLLRSQRLFLFINLARTLGLVGIYVAAKHIEPSAEMFVGVVSAFLFVFYSLASALVLLIVRKGAHAQAGRMIGRSEDDR